MLKQAIIDADALREVALKNAEAMVVQKYSNQIKEAVDTMLEQDEEEMLPPEGDMDMDMGMGMEDPMDAPPISRAAMQPEEELTSAGLEDQVTLAAIDGERLCPCPDEGTTIEIDFSGLQDLMSKLDEPEPEEGELALGGEDPMLGGEEMMPAPAPEDVLPGEEEEDFALQEGLEEEIMLELDGLLEEEDLEEDLEEELEEIVATDVNVHAETDPPPAPAASKEVKKKAKRVAPNPRIPARRAEMDKQTAAALKKTSQSLGAKADIGGMNIDRPHMQNKTAKEKEREKYLHQKKARYGLEEQSAALQENKVLTKTNSKVLNENKILKEQQQHIIKENKDLKDLLKKISGKLEEVNLSNAKLIYTNQVLNSASLNERQKQRIVESINNADSVDAAKSVYETLQSAVGSSLGSRNDSQSLSEAITRGSTTMLRQKQKKKTQDPHMERMKKLAGI
tara:strand:+ start:272 stop:1627 length:1356 start_codon:yes stop_codon:yes gene_type:complete